MNNELALQIASGIGSATALFTWPKLYAQVVSTRLKTKGLRTKRWNELLEKGKWRTALPILLEDAFAEAHGYSISDRDIRFSLGRSNTHSLLRDLRQCKGMVRLNENQNAFVSTRGKEWLSFRQKSILTFVIGYMPFGALFIFAPFIAAKTSPEAQIFLLVFTFLTMALGVFAAGWLEAAHRVVNGLDLRYPAWGDEMPSSLRDTPNLPSVTPLAANDAA
ncbi:hypothetical protein [Luteibacter sp. CQ10]|uniref:hypothetical protein n=1 Tax=Luteibacter sp. CQ10 TaxID=2805821 RepID=UPI0034A192A2